MQTLSRRFYSPQTWDARLTSGPLATSCDLLACCRRPVSNLVRSCASLSFYVAFIERLVASLWRSKCDLLRSRSVQNKMYITEGSSRWCQFYHCKVFKSFPYDIHVLTVLMQLLYPLPIHDIHLLTRAGIIMKSSLSFHYYCLLIIL